MGILKKILKKIAKVIHFRPYSEWTESEKAEYAKRHSFCSYSKSNNTEINPATGLPMIGALDSMGNSLGSSASDRDNYWNNDYLRHSTYNSSSYDPFINRY
ncbi:TPA: hypothetical protein KKX01_002724 [Legionella pneumophila]|nr:hypothetical protein [Legionella pneumophila]